MAIVTGDRYLEKLFNFVEHHAGPLIDGSLVLKLNPAGLHYIQSRLEALHELENLLSGAPVDYLRAYVSDLGDHRALEQLRRILRLLTSLKVVSVLPSPLRDPTPLSLLPFGRLKVLELRGCDLSTSAARGLLELRYTLEKIICHNSTDALRHVFASRIAEIKDSPQWNRLSFVSCAFNRLVLMDESLQLLPAVETLDLSRNKFAKVDNLRKCTKLKHLDLGFNHLTFAPFSEVSCHIVKLVLRNNALTTLCGLKNLKSLEGLDVSYNVISNFSELEYLASLPSLQNLWLEGNPLCCARWYRAQVFSYFAYSDTLKLDDKEISTREFWKRQIIIASRQKRPSSYGFYSPAKEDAEEEGGIIRKRRKVSRLAAIESEGDSIYFSSDQESPSCDNDIQSKEENVLSDDEAEIVDLINRVELMKREDSILWLREFKEWMDHESENYVDGGKHSRATLHHMKENHFKSKANQKHHGQSSRYALNSFHASGDETSIDGLDSDASSIVGMSLPGMVGPSQKYKNSHPHEGLTMQGYHRAIENGRLSPLTAIDDTTESHSSSAYPGSPPHYQVDLLHRRHNLVEEILQLSAESYSVASSDSDTSSSEDDVCEYGHAVQEDHSQDEEYLNLSVLVNSSSNLFDKNYDQKYGIHHLRVNGRFLFDPHDVQTSTKTKSSNSKRIDSPAVSSGGEISQFADEEADWLEKPKSKKRPRRRVISLLENGVDKSWTSERPSVEMDTCEADEEDEQMKQIVDTGNFHDITDKKKLQKAAIKTPAVANIGRFSDDFIEKYFTANVADSRINETCRHYLHCDCVIEPESLYKEREVAVLLSSANKLYVLLVGVAFDGSGNILSLLGWHRVEDVKEVLVGVGLQAMRVYIERGGTYLFLTRSIEKSRLLLYMLQVFVPCATNDKCLLRRFRLSCLRNKYVEVQKLAYSNMLWCFLATKMKVIESGEGPCVTLILEHATTKFRSSSKVHEENTASSMTWKLKWFSEDGLFNFVALLKAIHSGMKTSPLLITRML
ncbi:uncharacterized protein LOC110631290 isoform X2 [Manihot esculenta]|uniref:Uncharacterized protein n=1 Tax=Manihot esculenta TaxID=3983 RepID=A0ACB7GM40_MANES|nr:uncharacterized protein LOC110631290 isoform X2 [Manihot esculenta]KAG8639821.1 hypothetical protein MANES_14G172200v8 [Manihot esculenta]